MSTLLPLRSLWGLFLRESLGDASGSAVPPRNSAPLLEPREPSQPPVTPYAADGGSWEWCSGHSSAHARLTVAALFSGRIG